MTKIQENAFTLILSICFYNYCLFINYHLNQNRHSGPDFHRDKLQPESRVPGENRDPSLLRWFPTGVYPVRDTGSGRRRDVPVSVTGQAPQVRHDEKGCLWTDSN